MTTPRRHPTPAPGPDLAIPKPIPAKTLIGLIHELLARIRLETG